MRVQSTRIPPDWYIICPDCGREINLWDIGVFVPDPPPPPNPPKRKRPEQPKGPKYPREAYLNAKAVLDDLKRYRGKLTTEQLSTLRGQALSGDTDGAAKVLAQIVRRRMGYE